MWHTVPVLSICYSYRAASVAVMPPPACLEVIIGVPGEVQFLHHKMPRTLCWCGLAVGLYSRCYCEKTAHFQTFRMQQLFFKGFILSSLKQR